MTALFPGNMMRSSPIRRISPPVHWTGYSAKCSLSRVWHWTAIRTDCYYRAIAARWVAHLRVGGFCAVEVGYDQAMAVQSLFADAGMTDIETVCDAANIERVVIGRKKN